MPIQTAGGQTVLPNQENITNEIVKVNIVNIYDIKDDYHQILIRAPDCFKTAFSIPFGTYEYTQLPFGLASAPYIFQTYSILDKKKGDIQYTGERKCSVS